MHAPSTHSPRPTDGLSTRPGPDLRGLLLPPQRALRARPRTAVPDVPLATRVARAAAPAAARRRGRSSRAAARSCRDAARQRARAARRRCRSRPARRSCRRGGACSAAPPKSVPGTKVTPSARLPTPPRVRALRQLEPDEVAALRVRPARVRQPALERLHHRVAPRTEQPVHTHEVRLEVPARDELEDRRLAEQRGRDVGRVRVLLELLRERLGQDVPADAHARARSSSRRTRCTRCSRRRGRRSTAASRLRTGSVRTDRPRARRARARRRSRRRAGGGRSRASGRSGSGTSESCRGTPAAGPPRARPRARRGRGRPRPSRAGRSRPRARAGS